MEKNSLSNDRKKGGGHRQKGGVVPNKSRQAKGRNGKSDGPQKKRVVTPFEGQGPAERGGRGPISNPKKKASSKGARVSIEKARKYQLTKKAGA